MVGQAAATTMKMKTDQIADGYRGPFMIRASESCYGEKNLSQELQACVVRVEGLMAWFTSWRPLGLRALRTTYPYLALLE